MSQAEAPEQPAYLEIATTRFDCGDCGSSLLDRVEYHPDTPNHEVWLACPSCGWDDRPGRVTCEPSAWYQQRYTA